MMLHRAANLIVACTRTHVGTVVFWLAVVLLVLPLAPSSNASAQSLNTPASVSDTQAVLAATHHQEWVVVLKDPRPARLRGFQVRGYSKHYSQSLVLKRFAKKLAKQHKLILKQAWFIDSLGVYCLIVGFAGNPLDTLASLQKDKRVSWVQASNDFELLKADSDMIKTDSKPGVKVNDIRPGGQSEDQPSMVRPPAAPLSSLFQPVANTLLPLDGRGVRIALIDSAVSSRHPDLGNSIALNRDVVVGGASPHAAGERHGTAMAGILVAESNNPFGLRGVAPAAKVLAYRGCWETAAAKTRCNTLSLARALDGALTAQASILNLSLTGPRDPLLDRLVDKLVAQGVLVVTAFDPLRSQVNRFPSRRHGVLIVRAEHMNQDQYKEFTAPGTRIVIAPDEQYATMSGHSVAAAYTSGLLALVAQAAAERGRGRVNWSALIDGQGYPQIGSAQRIIQLKNL